MARVFHPATRLAAFALTTFAVLGSSGCLSSSSSQSGLFSRMNLFHRAPECGCTEGGEVIVSNGPVATEGPILTTPPQVTVPQATVLVAPPPRIINVPQQAPNVQYSPTGLKK